MKYQAILLALFAMASCGDAAPEVIHRPHQPPVHPAKHAEGQHPKQWHDGQKDAEWKQHQHDVELKQKFLAKKKAHLELEKEKKVEELKDHRRLFPMVMPSFQSIGLNRAWLVNDKTMSDAVTGTEGKGKSSLKLTTEGTNANAVGTKNSMAGGNYLNMHNSWSKDLFAQAPAAAVQSFPTAVPIQAGAGVIAGGPVASPFDSFKNFGAPFAAPNAFGGFKVGGVTAGAAAGEPQVTGLKSSWMKTASTMANVMSSGSGNGSATINAGKAGVEASSDGTEATANSGSFANSLDAWSDDSTAQEIPVQVVDPKVEVIAVEPGKVA